MSWSIVSFSNDLWIFYFLEIILGLKVFNKFSNCNLFILGEVQNLEKMKDELFDYFIYEFIFHYYFLKLLEQSKYLIIFPNYKIF